MYCTLDGEPGGKVLSGTGVLGVPDGVVDWPCASLTASLTELVLMTGVTEERGLEGTTGFGEAAW